MDQLIELLRPVWQTMRETITPDFLLNLTKDEAVRKAVATAIITAAATTIAAVAAYVANAVRSWRKARKENAVAAANEIEAFYADSSVWVVLKAFDYRYVRAPSPLPNLRKHVDITPDLLRRSLRHHTNVHRWGDIRGEASDNIFPEEEGQLRDIFDRFLAKLERIETLIHHGVISKKKVR